MIRSGGRKDATRRIYTRDTGKGPAILLLHAFPLNSRMWQPQIEALRTEHRLLAPDLPGHGLSPRPQGSPAIDDYADLVMEMLDEQKLEKLTVVGLSMGGYLAFRLVDRLGDRLAALLLADTRADADSPEAVEARHALAAQVESGGSDAAAAAILPKVVGTVAQRTHPDLIEQLRPMVLENEASGLVAALRAMAARPDSTGLLGRIRCPTVCVAGAEDALTPPEVARAMSEKIPDARCEVISEAGHLSNIESPDRFNEILRELITSAGAR